MRIVEETYIYDIDSKTIFQKTEIGTMVYVGLGNALFVGTLEMAIQQNYTIDFGEEFPDLKD